MYSAVFDGSYPHYDQNSRAALIITKGIFTCNTNYLSTRCAKKTYSCLFVVPPASHGLDVAYTYFTEGPPSIVVTNVTIADTMQAFITSFAKET